VGTKSIFKKIFLVMFLCCLTAVSAQEAQEQSQTPVNPEESILFGAPAPAETSAEIPPSLSRSPVTLFIRMVVVLALVVACIYGVMRFFRRGIKNAYASDPYLKRTASLTLSPGKTVHVITLDDSAFLIGVTDTAINLIGTVENKELVDAMNLHAEEESVTEKPKDFSQLLDVFNGKRKKKTSAQPFSEILEETAEVIRGQRGRLSGLKTVKQDDTE
jgi:flagellar protein FliO/FliZ